MYVKVDLLKKVCVVGSKKWANNLLKFFLNEILYNDDCWIHHPYNKIILAYDVIDRLNSYGFSWQSARLRNHLHRWMKKISCTRAHARARARDTLSKKREREVS